MDGHSVIFAWPELRGLHGRRMSSARDALVRVLTAYQDQSGRRVVLVFDGQGARVSEEAESSDGIQIFYAPAGSTADQIIERLVAKYAGTFRLIVASSDRMVEQTAFSFRRVVVRVGGRAEGPARSGGTRSSSGGPRGIVVRRIRLARM